MAFGLVQKASNRTGGGQPSVTVTLGATTANNLLVAFVTTDNGVSITPPAGFASVGTNTANGTMTGYWFIDQGCAAGLTTFLFSAGGSGASITADVWEFSGGPTSGSLYDSTASANGTGSGTAISVTGGVLADPTSLVMGGLISNNAVNSITAGGSFTDSTGTNSAATAANHSARSEYKVASATTAQTADGTSSSSSAWVAMLLVLKSSNATTAAVGLQMGDLTAGVAGTELFTAPATLQMGDLSIAVSGGTSVAAASLQLGDLTIGSAGSSFLNSAIALRLGQFFVNPFASYSSAAIALTYGAVVIGGTAAYSIAAVTLHTPSFFISPTAEEHLGPPTITSVVPTYGGQLQTVTITGTNFLTVSRVVFGPYDTFGYPFIVPNILSNTQMTVIAPDPFYLSTAILDNLTVDVQAINSDGTSPIAPDADRYTIVAPPVLDTVSPNVVFVSDGTAVLTLKGKNFQTANLLQVGNQDAAFTVDWAEDGLTATCSINVATLGLFPGTGAYEVKLWNASGPSAVQNPLLFILGGSTFTPGPLDWALSGRYGPVVVRYRYERRKRDFTFVQDMTDAVLLQGGCTVHLDNNQAVSRTADFTLRLDRVPAGFTGSIASGEGIAVWADVLVEGAFVAFPLGLFHLDTPTYNQSPKGYTEWAAKGSEVTVVLANRTTSTPLTVPAGTNYVAYIRTLCLSLGLSLGNFGGLQTTPVYFTWAPKTSYVQIVNDLLYGINYYPIFADAEGKLQVLPRVEPAKVPPAVRYSSADEPRMLDSSQPAQKSLPQTTFQNYVTVAIDDPARDPYNVAFTNADPSSPISTVASGREEVLAISGSSGTSGKCILDPTTADAIGVYELQEEATRAINRVIYTQPDPRRTNREYYRLKIEDYENETLWRVEKWDLVCETGGQMTHSLGTAAPVSISRGAPALTQIVQRIGTFGVANTSPLTADDCVITVNQTTGAGAGAALVILANQQPASVVDSKGNVYLPMATAIVGSPGFGVPGNHPDAGAGIMFLFLYVADLAVPLQGQGIDALTITPQTSPATYFMAAAAWELANLSAFNTDGTAGRQQQTDPAGANSLVAIDTGPSEATVQGADVIVGALGAVWASNNPAFTATFIPDALMGWDPSQATTIVIPVLNGIAAILFVNLQIAAGTGQFSLSGQLSAAAAGWGAFCAAIVGSTG